MFYDLRVNKCTEVKPRHAAMALTWTEECPPYMEVGGRYTEASFRQAEAVVCHTEVVFRNTEEDFRHAEVNFRHGEEDFRQVGSASPLRLTSSLYVGSSSE